MQDTVKIVFQAVGALSQTANNSIVVINGEQHSGSEFIQAGTSFKTIIVPYGSIVTVPGTSGYNNRITPLLSTSIIAASTTKLTFHAVFDIYISVTLVSSTASEE